MIFSVLTLDETDIGLHVLVSIYQLGVVEHVPSYR